MQNMDVEPDNQYADITIIGTGIAGRAAGLKIQNYAKKKGYPQPSLRFIEADSLPGGRTKTEERSGGIIVDTGGHWHHGPENSLFDWTEKHYPHLTFSNDTVEQDRGIILVEGSGRNEIVKVLPDLRLRALYALQNSFNKFARKHESKDTTLTHIASKISDPRIRAYSHYVAPTWMALESPDQISAREFGEDECCSGGMQVDGGVVQVTNAMMEQLINQGALVHYNSRIERVHQDEEGVTLVDNHNRIYRSSYVVSTIPVPALKNNSVLFDPVLPAKFQRRLDDLQSGTMNKIFVPLKPSFFDDRSIYPDTRVGLIDGDLRMLFHCRTNNTPAVTLFTGGRLAEEIEDYSPRELEGLVRHAFSRVAFLNGYEAHRSGDISITRWKKDAGGSYTSCVPGGKRIGAFQHNRVFHAGEAFVNSPSKSPGTMSAARISGKDAAGQVCENFYGNDFRRRIRTPVREMELALAAL